MSKDHPEQGRGPPPVASVIIPAHDAEGFIGEAIGSAQRQTLREIEIVVVDDCSLDGTWSVATAAAAADPRVVPIRRAARGGPAAARNEAIDRARGRWIAPLDADDLYLPERLERLTALAETRGADLLADNILERDLAAGTELGPLFPEAAMSHAGPLDPAEMLRRDRPDVPGRARLGFVKPIIRRGFLERSGVRYAEHLHAGEDFLLYFECVMEGARLHLAPEAYYIYRQRRGSVSYRASSALHYSEANRRLRELARRRGDRALEEMLRQRQRALDYTSFEYAVGEGHVIEALRPAHPGSRERLLSHLRVVARAMGR
jgi:succinoglycan biosynthesis protein ExoO